MVKELSNVSLRDLREVSNQWERDAIDGKNRSSKKETGLTNG